jgi:outer membrane protein assembly factor BamE (lipoprotein component of BamABCDE complex)
MKKAHFLLTLFAITLFYVSANADEPNWYLKLSQVKVLESSKQDVESLFGNPRITQSFENFGINFVFYETNEGEFTVQYSTGKCAAKDPDPESSTEETYKVEKDKVLKVIFFPKKKLKFSKFKVDKSQVFETNLGEDPALHYINTKQGIDYIVVLGKVRGVELFIPVELDYLRCLINARF